MSGSQVQAKNFHTVMSGVKGDVRLSDDMKAEFDQATANNDKISTQRRTHLTRIFQRFCEFDDFEARLNEEKFKNEGKFPDGKHGKATIYAVKVWQWRLYGAVMAVDGRRAFVGVKVDPSKKQDRANRQLLESAALEIGKLAEYRSK